MRKWKWRYRDVCVQLLAAVRSVTNTSNKKYADRYFLL